MASGKHSRRKRRRKRSGRVSTSELLEQARRLLAKGDARGALERLKRIQDKEGDLEEWALLHFCAFIQRSRELAERGQRREAASMRARAAAHRASILPETLGEDDLLRYFDHLDAGDAVAAYAAHLKAGPTIAGAERSLADRLVVRRRWEALEVLDEGHALRRDAGHVMRSLEAMDAGEWARASDLLRGLPRRSPFAGWRIFCKAMACFGAGDDEGLRRALALLPPGFVLTDTVAELKGVSGSGVKGGSARTQRALGTDGAAVAALGDELRQALRSNERPRAIERLMNRLADALCPEDPLPALVDLVQVAGLATARSRLSLRTVEGLAQQLLPGRRVPGVLARIGLVLQKASLDSWDPRAAVTLFGRLSTEFPRAGDRSLVKGRVFEALARAGHRTVQPEFLPPPMERALCGLLDVSRIETGTLFADLMEASLASAPDNREGYRFLVELLSGGRENKARQGRVLQDMALRFPDDAEPWLELATLHYSGNAYRKAEQALAEARRCAPHDERIVDLQAVGFLKSSDQSRKSGRFEMAARDLERAEALGRAGLTGIVASKRLVLEVVSSGRDAAETVAPHLEGLAAAGQIRTLALLLHELDANRNIKNVTPDMASAVRGLLTLKAPLIGELDADAAAGLLAPQPADLRILYGRLHVAPVLFDWWGAIMRKQRDEGLLDVFDILMGCGGREAVRAEINRRLSGEKKAGRDPVLLLYLAVIRYQEGDDYDSRRFEEALDAAAPSDRKRLRAGAERLARGASGVLREALQTLDFGVLDPFGPVFGDDLPPPLSSLLDALVEPEEDLEDEGPSLEAFMDALRPGLGKGTANEPRQGMLFDGEAMEELDALESLIDRHELRGVPSPLLRELAEFARVEPEIRHNLDRAARKCEEAGLRGGLTREARIFLFPRAYGRRRRLGA